MILSELVKQLTSLQNSLRLRDIGDPPVDVYDLNNFEHLKIESVQYNSDSEDVTIFAKEW